MMSKMDDTKSDKMSQEMTLSPKPNNNLSNDNIVPFIVKRPKSSTGYSGLNKARTR